MTSSLEQAKRLTVHREMNPLLQELPKWVTSFRTHQVEAINAIMAAYQRGVRMVVVDAPTGSGKSLIGETVRRMLNTQGIYLCSTKSLQEQFIHDFPNGYVLKGRSNYPTQLVPEVTTENCMGKGCVYCTGFNSCPYITAKQNAISASLAILNYAYYLNEVTYVGGFSDRSFVICDEADLLESEMMKFVSVTVSGYRIKQYEWNRPRYVGQEKYESWIEWIDTVCKDISYRLLDLNATLAPIKTKRDPAVLKQITRLLHDIKLLDGLSSKLAFVRMRLLEDPFSYVYDDQGEGVAFKPVWVAELGETYLWRHAQRWLLMSATVISPGDMMDAIGWREPYEVVRVPSTFPVENRPIYVRPVANMTRKTMDDEIPKLLGAIVDILGKHSDERVLIHTASYGLAQQVSDHLRRTTNRLIVTYTSAAERDDALERYQLASAAVMVASSLERGVSLDDDLCRVIIVAKVMYPSLADRQTKARLGFRSARGNAWYTAETVRSLVQSTGRGVRSEQDSAVTYILDSQFQALYNRAWSIFPRWWTDALVWE